MQAKDELIKVVWNLFVLRDSVQKGEMTTGVWLAAGLFLLGIAGIAFPLFSFTIVIPMHPHGSSSGPRLRLECFSSSISCSRFVGGCA
jgi:hypothetical protein